MRLNKEKKKELLDKVLRRHIVLPKVKELVDELSRIFLQCVNQAFSDLGIDMNAALQREKEIIKQCQEFEEMFYYKFHTTRISSDCLDLGQFKPIDDLSHTDYTKLLYIVNKTTAVDSNKRYITPVVNLPDNARYFLPNNKDIVKDYLQAQHKEIGNIIRKILKLYEEYSVTETETQAILNSVNTVKQLLEAWPEVKDILPAEWLTKPKPKLPVTAMSKTNKSLDLPPE